MAQPLHSETKSDVTATASYQDPGNKTGLLNDIGLRKQGGREDLERRALWKLDLTVMPIVAMFYFFSFLDRSNFGNARVAGLQSDLHLSDHQYSVALTVTYIPYIMAEIPANLVLKKLGANLFLPSIVTIWGVITTMEGFITNYPGLIAARFFLGLVEGGMSPAIILYLSYFYTRRELQLRIAFFFSSAALSGAFSGLLAYAFVKLDGKAGRPGWAWIFIIEGSITVLWGIISFFIFPASIDDSKFLNPSEKKLLKARLADDCPMADEASEQFTMTELLAALKSPHVLINSISLFLCGTAAYSLAYFQPTIVHSLGYSASRSQLISVPPFAVSFFVVLLSAYVSDRYLGRGVVACASALVGMAGFLMFHLADPKQTSLKYGSLFLSVSGVYSATPALNAWQSNNSQAHYRRASAIALGTMSANCGGMLSTWIFPQSEKPRYRTGTLLNLSFCVGIMITVAINMTWLKWANRSKCNNREKILRDYPGHDSCSDFQTESNINIRPKAWAELGDQHPDFKYTL